MGTPSFSTPNLQCWDPAGIQLDVPFAKQLHLLCWDRSPMKRKMFCWVVGALVQLDLLKTLSEGPGPDTP